MNSHLYQLQQCQSDRKLNKGVLKKRNTAKHNLLEVTRSVAKHATSPPKFQKPGYVGVPHILKQEPQTLWVSRARQVT